MTALADWTPTNAKFQSAATELGDTSMYYDMNKDVFVVVNWRDDPTLTYCSSPSSFTLNADTCRYINYPVQYEVKMVPLSTGSVVQIDAKPPASQGQATTYTSGFMFNIGGTVNVAGPGIGASATWNNLVATSVPPLELELGNTGNQGAIWTFKYCTGGDEPDPDTNCTSHVQLSHDVCPRAQLGDFTGNNPQQGQTPEGKFSDAVQSAYWQAGPDTRGGGTFDIAVSIVPTIGYTAVNLWGASGDDHKHAGCDPDNCYCDSHTSTEELIDGGSFTFAIPLPSTQCQP